ncbi:cryptochrome-1-like [Acanthaster planci]|uniref:Cryptochrome-1-like n=1 Tax=Acanthaster planci TaxID=133434 RepID=A0A8B7YMN4_ACAPL|nr:cryptochrome-1-like [Acanthaster planci]
MGKRKRSRGSSRRGVSLVHWFRNKGLRLHDNPALREALVGAKTFRCVYILDPWFARSPNQGVNKWRFLLQCLEDLDSSLRKLNSRLFLVRGQPSDVFPKLFKEWGVTRLSFEEDPEVFGIQRDAKIKTLAATFKVQVITRMSHTLYDPKEIVKMNNSNPPLTYKHFQYLISLLDQPTFPEETITLSDIEGINTAIAANHDSKYGLATLEELGFDSEDIPPPVWIGGETVAKQQLDRHLERKAWVANFERPRMSSASLMACPTGLGPYLRFGCLSPRLFYWRLTELYQKMKKTSNIPLFLHGQLYWREFFFTLGYNNQKLDQMVGNPICIQIPWEKNEEALQRWRDGQTGFPWIDAIMIQLRQEGWVHPVARHAVACFLTRGDLWISWEEGAKIFEDLLLDADWSVNAGNWIWLSCSSFYQQFFHCYTFCPVKFGQQTDPNGDFIRKYIPALKNFSSKYIYNPWTAPLEIQEQAKCTIGKDYPFPMVNHNEAIRRNTERMNNILQNVSSKTPKYIHDECSTGVPSFCRTSSSTWVSNTPQEPLRKMPHLSQDSMPVLSHDRMLSQGSMALLPQDEVPGTSGYMSTNQSTMLTLTDPYTCNMTQESLVAAQPSQDAPGTSWNDSNNLANQYFNQ